MQLPPQCGVAGTQSPALCARPCPAAVGIPLAALSGKVRRGAQRNAAPDGTRRPTQRGACKRMRAAHSAGGGVFEYAVGRSPPAGPHAALPPAAAVAPLAVAIRPAWRHLRLPRPALPSLPQGTGTQKLADWTLAAAIPVHMHISTNACVTDYVPTRYRSAPPGPGAARGQPGARVGLAGPLCVR